MWKPYIPQRAIMIFEYLKKNRLEPIEELKKVFDDIEIYLGGNNYE